MAKQPSNVSNRSRPMTKEERKVIIASSAGTIFEWYDFYLYGSLAAIIGANYFTAFPEATRNVFALLAFAAGFIVRPFGALFFGAMGDLIGRKYTFLATILIMGASTFLVGLLPGIFAYTLYGWAQTVLGASRVGMAMYLAPLWAAVVSRVFLAEPLGWHHLVGALLILPGVALVQRSEKVDNHQSAIPDTTWLKPPST